MIVTAAMVLVVNAQLTWWIVFILGQNSTRLELERGLLVVRCAQLATEVATAEAQARASLETALVAGQRPGVDAAPAPFATWSVADDDDCSTSWAEDGPSFGLTVRGTSGCVTATASPEWSAALLDLPADLERVTVGHDEATQSAPPAIDLPPPFASQQLRPTPSMWAKILDGHRGRIVMMVSEGSFFALLLFVIIGILWKTLRREVELERQHRNFLSAITHELKSPLAAMRLSIETVLRGRADSSASVRFLENALQDTERLQSLVQKVLEVTRYGHAGGSLQLARTCLSDVVDDALATFGRRATVAGVEIDREVEPEVWLHLDGEACAIVISNLLENAIKYGGTLPRVGVRLAVDDRAAILDVRDNGRGISEEEIPFIFNRFYRGGDEMTRTTQGTGLGLYLVRQIVEAHQGTVEVHSTGSDGTTFRVRLPGAEVWEESV
jgi:signal transduction histidine kinase